MRIPDIRGFLHPLGGQTFEYVTSDVADSGDPAYYGFISHLGSWIIMKQIIADGSYRYAAGKSDYSTNWTDRSNLTYNYFNEIYS